MLSIDEAIAHAREKAKEQRYYANFEKNYLMRQSCLKCAEEHEQLAEWLEDYKQIKMLVPIEQALKTEYNKGYSKAENDYHAQSEKDRQSSYDCGYDAGYSKAIDVACEYLKCEWAVDNLQTCDDFDKIAEQLKAGESE